MSEPSPQETSPIAPFELVNRLDALYDATYDELDQGNGYNQAQLRIYSDTYRQAASIILHYLAAHSAATTEQALAHLAAWSQRRSDIKRAIIGSFIRRQPGHGEALNVLAAEQHQRQQHP